MEQWLTEGLSRILGFEVPEDLIRYVLSIENEADLNEYLKTLLDFDNPHHKNFVSDLMKRKFPSRVSSLPKQQKKKISKSKQSKTQEFVSAEPPPPEKENSAPEGKSKKTKFVNLYSQEGKNAQVVQLKGRHHCDCQASKHDLINNCLQCGRVVCKQEGSGPCLFCGNLVCTPEEQKELNAKTRASAKLMESLMERNRPQGWEAAVSHRNRLLEYDRTSERRTRVTDDDSDYFSAGSVWLNPAEKGRLEQYQQAIQDKKHASRLSKKMTFDFAGRQVVEDNTIDYEVDEDKIREMSGGGTSGAGGGSQFLNHDFVGGGGGDRDVAPGVNANLLQFDASVEGANYAAAVARPLAQAPRVQDPELQEMGDAGRCLSMHQPWASLLVEGIKILELQEMGDAGRCLSMHQPWASLLVEGIKMHEGRTWYTSHRGRLWIASTVKPPDQDVIRALENQYRVLYPDKQLKFPSFYPTGCLLGCVTVDDCLPQEEYGRKFPSFYPTGCLLGCVTVDACLPQEEYERKYAEGGESDSPYVFICSNPISLRLRFPITGQHKIYSLDKTIHYAALKCIQKTSKMQAAGEANAG